MLEEAKPFIKWAGGKRQLLDELTEGLPDFENYHEPFIGGGALFFRLETKDKIQKAYLSDSNKELINAYSVIRNEVFELMAALSSPIYANNEAAYYKIRASRPTSRVDRAARFIYLNKTAFNGLYRVNSKGGFKWKIQRSIWKIRQPKILDRENLSRVNS